MKKTGKIPDRSEWVLMKDAAAHMGVSVQNANNMRSCGKLSVMGASCRLAAWKTPMGWVTTHRAMEDFLYALNDMDRQAE